MKKKRLFNGKLKKDIEKYLEDWFKQQYQENIFFTERDVVWRIQVYLDDKLNGKKQKYFVFNDYTIVKDSKGKGRKPGVDLAIVEKRKDREGKITEGKLKAILEFKFEPRKGRTDIPLKKRGEIAKTMAFLCLAYFIMGLMVGFCF